MEEMGVISGVTQPTPWCAGMVVLKSSGEVRICVDLKPLNESVLREVYPSPNVDEQLSGATLFSKLDANSGFWQIPLAEESKLYTTFITPFGRYCFNKLPSVYPVHQSHSKGEWGDCWKDYQESYVSWMMSSFLELTRRSMMHD